MAKKEEERNPLYEKWWFWLLIIVGIGVIIGGSNFNKIDSTENSTYVKGIFSTEEGNSAEVKSKGNIGNCDIEIGDFIITQDYNGTPILLVKITFANNNDETKSFYTVVKNTAYQNGVEIKAPISTYGISNYDWQDKNKEVQPGIKYEFNLAYELNNQTSDVTVELTPYFSTKYSTKITKTFKIN